MRDLQNKQKDRERKKEERDKDRTIELNRDIKKTEEDRPDEHVHSVRGKGQPVAAQVHHLHQRGAGLYLIPGAPQVLLVRDAAGQPVRVRLPEVLQKQVGVHNVVDSDTLHGFNSWPGRGNM